MDQHLSLENLGCLSAAKQSNLLIAAAADYVSTGWPVIPLQGKHPTVCWKQFQTRLPTQNELHEWFVQAKYPPTGLAIITGTLSGLVVVDCDSNEDAAFWRSQFPRTDVAVQTGGGGTHFYYLMPDETEIRNRAGVLKRRIDIRGEGGYATAPPSTHPNGKRYDWLTESRFPRLPQFDPHWIGDVVTSSSFPHTSQSTCVRNAVAYIRHIKAVAGERGHNATFRVACKLRDSGLLENEALTILSQWNETNATPAWTETELRHKIRSAYNLRRE